MEQHISLSHSVKVIISKLIISYSFWRSSYLFVGPILQVEFLSPSFIVVVNLTWRQILKLFQLRRKQTLSYKKVLPFYHDFQPLICSHFQVDSTSNLPIKKIFLKF